MRCSWSRSGASAKTCCRELQAHQVKRVPAAETVAAYSAVVPREAGRNASYRFAWAASRPGDDLNHPPPTAHSTRRGNSPITSHSTAQNPIGQPVPCPHAATARKISNAPEHSTAYYFIEGLNELGIEHLFCNFGTDHAPTIEAMADRAEARREGAERDALPAREHRGAHGDGLRGGDRPRPGRAGACRRRHRQHRQRDAQHVPQPPAGAADVRQGALHLRATSWSARATPTCISCRSRSTRARWCGPT